MQYFLAFLMIIADHFAHASTVDSLLQRLQQLEKQCSSPCARDSVKVMVLNDISRKLMTQHPDSAINYASRAMALAKQADYKRGLAQTIHTTGMIYYFTGNFEKALEYFKKSAEARKAIGDKEGVASAYNNIGGISYNLGYFQEAVKYYLKALKIREEIGFPEGIAASNTNIGIIYYEQENFEKALEYFTGAIKIYEKAGELDSLNAAVAFNNVGITYQRMNELEKAYSNYLKSLVIYNKHKEPKGLSTTYTNFGKYFLEKYKQSPDHHPHLDSSIFYFSMAYKLQKQIQDNWTLLHTLNGLGEAYLKKDLYADAIVHFEKALEAAAAVGARKELYEAYHGLATGNEMLGNYSDAYQYHKEYAALRDSVYSSESMKKIAEVQAIYKDEKRQKEITLLKKDRELQQAEIKENRLMLLGSGGVLFLVLAFSALLLNRFRITRKQKKIIEMQKEVVEDKNKNITDSINYASRIQEAILPVDEHLQKLLSDHFVLYKPKDIVSGDFYWISEKENALFIAAVDCTGHGVPGALMSVMGNSLLNEIINEKNITTPGKVLDELRNSVIKALKQREGNARDGMDMALVKIVKHQNNLVQVSYAGAYNPLYYFSHGNLNQIKGDRQPVGLHLNEEKSFTTHDVELSEGDCIYLFSDGYADQFGGQRGKKLGYKNFQKLLTDIYPLQMKDQKNRMEAFFDSWRKDEPQIDDVLVIGVRL